MRTQPLLCWIVYELSPFSVCIAKKSTPAVKMFTPFTVLMQTNEQNMQNTIQKWKEPFICMWLSAVKTVIPGKFCVKKLLFLPGPPEMLRSLHKILDKIYAFKSTPAVKIIFEQLHPSSFTGVSFLTLTVFNFPYTQLNMRFLSLSTIVWLNRRFDCLVVFCTLFLLKIY